MTNHKSLYFQLLSFFVALFVSASAFAVPAEGHKMMVTGPSPHAVTVAKKIIKKGGNAVDVAVAMGLTLAVTSPYFASFGGGGFALVKMNKKPVEALDFREMAPAKTGKDYYFKKDKDASRKGPHAVGVPGVPAGLKALHKKYGKLRWGQLFDEPVRMAAKGFQLSGEWVNRTTMVSKDFNDAAFKHLFKANKVPYKPGEILKQPALAKVLRKFRASGNKAFYQGEVARDIVDTVQKKGGVLSMTDMKNYKVRWLKPITTSFAGHQVYLMPPPSSGGIVLKTALGLTEKLRVRQYKPLSVNELHLLAEIMKVSFRGRALLGDPDYHKNPIQQLTGPEQIKRMSEQISTERVLKLKPVEVAQYKESKETTHYGVLDAQGNAVSITVTVNSVYGSKLVSEKFGVALNNEMDDFTTKPDEPNQFELIQGTGNLVEPGKRPLSSMSPTIVTKDGKAVMAIGAQGGPMIISSVYQSVYRSLINKFNMDESIQFPRLHHQFAPDQIFYEDNKFSPLVLQTLRDKGHKLAVGWKSKAYGVKKNTKGFLEAAFDSRNEGAAGGY